MIRKVKSNEVYRLAEIIVFNNRKYYYPIFNDIEYSFKLFNVKSVGDEHLNDSNFIDNTYVYEDEGVIKGYIYIKDKEIVKLYVDIFFQHNGIGDKLIKYAIEQFGVNHLYVLERNTIARNFYTKHGFIYDNNKMFEEGTTEYLLHMVKK